MNNITNSAKQQAVNLAKQIAKDISNEPGEILKDTSEQLTGIEQKPSAPTQMEQEQTLEVDKQQMEAQGKRQLMALENEIKDIQVQKEREKVQLENQEIQQKQYEAQVDNQNTVIQPSSKQGRKFGMGHKVKQQQTRIEKPLPPTG
jgi:hypothetical protein